MYKRLIMKSLKITSQPMSRLKLRAYWKVYAFGRQQKLVLLRKKGKPEKS